MLTGLGSFGTLSACAKAIAGMADPVMVQSTDGVGTKTKVTVMARAVRERLGRDLVAAVAGDIAVMGARPLTFLDYLGLHKTDPAIVEQLVKRHECGVRGSRHCAGGRRDRRDARGLCEGELDVVGFVTGVVDRAKLITGADDCRWRRAVRRALDGSAYQRLVAGAQAAFSS